MGETCRTKRPPQRLGARFEQRTDGAQPRASSATFGQHAATARWSRRSTTSRPSWSCAARWPATRRWRSSSATAPALPARAASSRATPRATGCGKSRSRGAVRHEPAGLAAVAMAVQSPRRRGAAVDFAGGGRIVQFDGRLPHEVVRDSFHGDRFTVIWYKCYDHRKRCDDPLLVRPCFVDE